MVAKKKQQKSRFELVRHRINVSLGLAIEYSSQLKILSSYSFVRTI
jgi:hypothetical protein